MHLILLSDKDARNCESSFAIIIFSFNFHKEGRVPTKEFIGDGIMVKKFITFIAPPPPAISSILLFYKLTFIATPPSTSPILLFYRSSFLCLQLEEFIDLIL